MNEVKILRRYIRSVLAENSQQIDQYVDDLENEIFELLFTRSTFDHLQKQKQGQESTIVMDTKVFQDFDNIQDVHLGIVVNDEGFADLEAAYVCVPADRSKSNLVLSINIPRTYPNVDGFQDWLSGELADSLSHEIQHSCDATDLLSMGIPEGEEKWDSLDNIFAYYGSDAETRGHVAGIIGRARRTGQDPYDLLDQDMQTIMMKALDRGYKEKQLIPIIQNIYSRWNSQLGKNLK